LLESVPGPSTASASPVSRPLKDGLRHALGWETVVSSAISFGDWDDIGSFSFSQDGVTAVRAADNLVRRGGRGAAPGGFISGLATQFRLSYRLLGRPSGRRLSRTRKERR
jgi:hypothetical protein